MASLLERILDAQYRRPTGWLGAWIGARMARDHRPENLWTVQVLDPQPADCLLEIGFGAGVAIQELSKIVVAGSICGIDFSRAMLAAARRRNAAAVRAGRVKLYLGDAAELPFEPLSFDKAYSIHSIYFWPDPARVLRAIWQVLRPGGILVLTVLPREYWNAGQPDKPVGTPECRPYTGAELASLLREAGFSATRIAAHTDPRQRSSYCVVGER